MEKNAPSQASSPPPGGEKDDGTLDFQVPATEGATIRSSNITPQGYDESKEPDHINGMPLVALMVCVCLVCFLLLLDTSIIATAIPRITDEFHSLRDVGWYGSAYQLACAALQPLAGRVYTIFNSKWSFLVFFFLFELGSLLCGVAGSSTALIVGRAVAGMGASGLMNGSLTIISRSAPPAKRPLLTGITLGLASLGVAFGPLIGGAITEYSTWRWCFYMNLPIGGVVGTLVALIHIPDQEDRPQWTFRTLHYDLDLIGFAILAPSAIQLLLAIQYGGAGFAWNSPTVIGLFCGSGAAFVAWFAWNWHRRDMALIPLSIASKTVVWSGALTQMFLMTTMFVSSYFLPLYFQAVKGMTPFMSGVSLLPTIVPQLVFSILSGGLGK
jgi:MFS family permease